MSDAVTKVGPIGRLGRWSATHFKWVLGAWVIIALGLGFLAPRVETSLSGAGWEDTGSQSVQARQLIQENFNGNSANALMVVVHSPDETISSPAFKAAIAKATTTLTADGAVTDVVPPVPGQTISRDGHTAILMAGAAENATGMVRAADRLKAPLQEDGAEGVSVYLTGASGMWSDFNEANRSAMLKSELISWPVTLAILLLAFGALVAAGLPLLLTILGLVATAGALYLATLAFDVSIWAMNFALMFALALGIAYALFLVQRFRGSLFGSGRKPVDAVTETMDTAGKAVLFSGLTVLISLSAVLIVPSPAFRSMALGIMISVVFILLATLTLLPAVLAKLGPRVDKGALKWAHNGDHRSARFARWGEKLWSRPLLYGLPALIALLILAVPVFGLQTGMPSITVVPEDDGSRQGYALVSEAFGEGAPGTLQIVGPAGEMAAVQETVAADAGIAGAMPPMQGGGGLAMVQAVPTTGPSTTETAQTIERLRGELPPDVLIGGAAAEQADLSAALSTYTPIVIGIVLLLGFLLLLVAFQAPVVAAIGVITNLLAVGAAFGVARLIFQDGWGADLLGFEAQGFLDAWGPVFFFAMIFAISMDYTVFLLSSAREHWDRSGDAKEAMVGGMAHSGRVIMAAAAVMVAVFFTFALSGPLPPKEMGIILGVAVLLDALLVRLLLVPVALRLVGRWAWWQPKWLDRILPDVRFGH
jgi:putative drug exporter of the RND superfamily